MTPENRKLLASLPRQRHQPTPPSQDLATFGGRLTRIMEEQGVSLFTLVGRLQVSDHMARRWMRNRSVPQLPSLQRLIRALGIADEAERVRWLVMGDK